jgi:hypothetical protein
LKIKNIGSTTLIFDDLEHPVFKGPEKACLNGVQMEYRNIIANGPITWITLVGGSRIGLSIDSPWTGEIWEPKAMGVVGCSWLYVYPYKSGKVNYMITGMAYGMIARQVFPEGKVLVSIPWNWIPVITQNLNEMEWVLPGYNKEKYRAEMDRLGKKFKLGL